jgi:hypothetical protein
MVVRDPTCDEEMTAMRRTTLVIDGRSYELAQGTLLDELKSLIEAAVHDGGRFVDVTVVGNVAISILVSPGVPILLTTRQVSEDDRDTGDLDEPFDITEWEIHDSHQ